MTEQDQRVVERFLADGRLRRLPAKAAKRELVLSRVAQLFEPGVRYSERQVDAVLEGLCRGGETDHVTLRRYLVDLRLLDREAGEYWRSGGWVEGT